MSSLAASAPTLASTAIDASFGQQVQYRLNSRVMVAATLILCIVVLFVVSLHVYAKWFWARGRASAAAAVLQDSSWRRPYRPSPSEFIDVRSFPASTVTLTGLDPATISSLPTFTYQALHSPHDAASPLLECAVCLSEFQRLEKGRILPCCRHRFHIGCIDVWLRSHSTCPLCRMPVSPWTANNSEQNACPQPNFASYSVTNSNQVVPTSTDHLEELAIEQFFRQSTFSNGPPSQRLLTETGHSSSCHPVAYLHVGQNPQVAAKSEELSPRQNFNHVTAPAGSKLMMDSLCASSSSTKSVSRDLEQQEVPSISIARCQSLGMTGHAFEDTDARELQPAKSRSFRMSIRRLINRDLSWGKGRIFPSAPGAEGPEEQGHQFERNPSRNIGLPV